MNSWAFMDYLDARRVNIIAEWLNDRQQVPRKAKAKIETVLRYLAGTPLWVRPYASNVTDHQGIVEIRIRWMNVQYRPLGFRGPDEGQFTILVPAIAQGGEFVPLNAPGIAETRLAEVLADSSRACEHRS